VNRFGIQPWQLPIFATIVIVLLEIVGDGVLRTNTSPEVRRRIRTGALILLVLLTVVIFVVALGPSLADQLSSVAAFALTGVAVFLAFRSYQSPRPGAKPAETKPAEPRPDDVKAEDQVTDK
jgi:small-conductance mechanosensitive channel